MVSPNGCSRSDLSTSGCQAASTHSDFQTSRPQTQQLNNAKVSSWNRQDYRRALAFNLTVKLFKPNELTQTQLVRGETNQFVYEIRETKKLSVQDINIFLDNILCILRH